MLGASMANLECSISSVQDNNIAGQEVRQHKSKQYCADRSDIQLRQDACTDGVDWSLAENDDQEELCDRQGTLLAGFPAACVRQPTCESGSALGSPGLD